MAVPSKIFGLAIALVALAGCVGTVDPMTRGAEGGVGGAMAGCAMGALMTIWAPPIAPIGCGMGAMAGAGAGGMMGVATAPPLPPGPQQTSWPPPPPGPVPLAP